MTLTMDFAVVVGSSLLRSHELTSDNGEVHRALNRTPVDGALVLAVDGHVLVDEHLWDRLDEILLQLDAVITRLERSDTPGDVRFPDTRIILKFRVGQGGSLHISHDAAAVECVVDEFIETGRHILARYENLLRDVGAKTLPPVVG